MKRITHTKAMGTGFDTKTGTTTLRITFPIEITEGSGNPTALLGDNLGFRTFRPGRKPNKHITP